jgi:hypothetical protein
MKYLVLIPLVFSLGLQNTFAQDKAKIKAEATITANAFAKGDYKTFTDHLYPKMIEMAGGKKTLLQLMDQQIGMMKKQGLAFEKVTIGEPGEIFKAGTELHCLVPETIVVKMQGKYVSSTSHLLAVSSDKGKRWTFVDTSTGSPEQMKQMFPNWNEKLVIPRPTQPVYSNTLP